MPALCVPRRGDIVHFMPYASELEHHVAIVLDVDSSGSCRLLVHPSSGERTTVMHDRRHGDTPGTWHYREECDR